MFNNFKVGTRLFSLTTIALLMMIIVGIVGFYGISKISGEAESMYENATVPLSELGAMNGTLGKICADILLALQHNPDSPQALLHDHPVDVHIKSAEHWRSVYEQGWAAYKNTFMTDKEKELARKVDENYAPFMKEAVEPTLVAIRAGDFSAKTTSVFLRGFRAYAENVEMTIGELIALQSKIAGEEFKEVQADSGSAKSGMLVTTLVGILLATALAWGIIQSITRPLVKVQTAMADIEKTGDFTHRAPVAGTDEVGQTASSFNVLLESLQKSIRDVLEHTVSLDQAATELAATSEQSAKGSEMTSESSAAMASSVEEMTVSINMVSENARETADITTRTGELSARGGEVISRTVEEMRAMAEAVRSSSSIIAELGQQSEQISGIVQVIKDVADQTNLLALNAAIEAARAGEQGRGFAVVADEVRKLAERTAGATGEISAMITAIQTSSHSAVDAMHKAAERVESGVALADQAGQAIADIQQGAGQVADHVNDITSALSEQGQASQNIAQQVERVAQAAEENSAAARSSSDAAARIEALGKGMRESMAKFRV